MSWYDSLQEYTGQDREQNGVLTNAGKGMKLNSF